MDGKSINLNINNWQKNIGYIPQNIIILNQSLKKIFHLITKKIKLKIKKLLKY